jgi:hypothetical protein
MQKPVAPPWWLEGGTEACSGCTHLYFVEMEFRCVACDRGICCHCVWVADAARTVLCAACAAEQQVSEPLPEA